MTHHADELVKVYSSVPVGVGLPEHLVALLEGEGVPVLCHGGAQLLPGDGAIAVVVKRPENNIPKLRVPYFAHFVPSLELCEFCTKYSRNKEQ